MKTPYIGITDFANVEHVRQIRGIFESCSPMPWHILMVGAMMSLKTLLGRSSRWADIFPPKERLPEIFSETRGVLNTLHYADYSGESTSEHFLRALSYCGPNIHALQLDMTWPDPDDVKDLKRSRSDIEVVLQIGPRAFSEGPIVSRFLPYHGCVDYVLLDRSMGKGVAMDPEFLRGNIEALKHATPDWELGIAVAGGLGPGTVQAVKPLVDQFGVALSVDAQGKLRKSGDTRDPIDRTLTEQYVREALDLFSVGKSL